MEDQNIKKLALILPLWGTVTGLLLATGWQLCIEYHTDRSSSPEPQFHD